MILDLDLGQEVAKNRLDLISVTSVDHGITFLVSRSEHLENDTHFCQDMYTAYTVTLKLLHKYMDNLAEFLLAKIK